MQYFKLHDVSLYGIDDNRRSVVQQPYHNMAVTILHQRLPVECDDPYLSSINKQKMLNNFIFLEYIVETYAHLDIYTCLWSNFFGCKHWIIDILQTITPIFKDWF